jgi:hypothetical protein
MHGAVSVLVGSCWTCEGGFERNQPSIRPSAYCFFSQVLRNLMHITGICHARVVGVRGGLARVTRPY